MIGQWFTDTTPAGRQTLRTVDALGRAVRTEVAGLAPTAMTYDAHGRLASITQGTGAEARTSTFSYDTLGNLATITDAAGRQMSFGYDAAGRVTSQLLPDGRVIAYTYDSNGNITTVTPPGRPTHGFDYTPVDLRSVYAPPLTPNTPTPNTLYSYNLDRQLSRITRPDGLLIDFLYDLGGPLGGRRNEYSEFTVRWARAWAGARYRGSDHEALFRTMLKRAAWGGLGACDAGSRAADGSQGDVGPAVPSSPLVTAGLGGRTVSGIRSRSAVSHDA